MRLSTTTDVLADKFDLNKAIDIISASGYDAADFSNFKQEYYTDAHNEEFYTELRKYAEDKGIVFNQSHAPFPSTVTDELKNEEIFAHITTAMKHASLLGIKTIIVHPCQHIQHADDNNAEILFEYNMNFYKKLIPYCEEYDIRVALENMWQIQNYNGGWRKIIPSTCARPAEFIRYLDELNNDCFVACLDIGHATLVCENVPDFIKALGNKRLQALHVHDVDGVVDSHTLPFFGVTEWDKVMKALADIDYKGDLTFEADSFFKGKPLEIYPDCAMFMAKTGRYLVNKFNEYKK